MERGVMTAAKKAHGKAPHDTHASTGLAARRYAPVWAVPSPWRHAHGVCDLRYAMLPSGE